jgi:hypothetical protein
MFQLYACLSLARELSLGLALSSTSELIGGPTEAPRQFAGEIAE